MRRIFGIYCVLACLLGGCFVNYPLHYGYEDLVQTKQSLTDFVQFAKDKDISYRVSLGSLRNLGLYATGMIALDSYGTIWEDQIPGKAGIEIEAKNYQPLPLDFVGAQTGIQPFFIKGRLAEKSKKAIILLHGLLFSKRTYFLQEFATVAAEFGFTVVLMDLRGHGESLTQAEMSVGVFEALDVCYLARKLKHDCGMEYVGVVGFSLGAHTAIRAGYEASWEAKMHNSTPAIDAVVAISPPCDMKMALADLGSTGLGCATNNFFAGVFQSRIAAFKEGNFLPQELEIAGFNDYLDKVMIPHYKNSPAPPFPPYFEKSYRRLAAITPGAESPYRYLHQRTQMYRQKFQDLQKLPELLELASTYKALPEIEIPLLVIHAKDDTTVLVEHSRKIAEVVNAHHLNNILVLIVPDGGHIALHKVDPNWTFNIVYGFHHYHAYPEQRNQFQPIRMVGPLWYYFDKLFDFRPLRMSWALF